MGAVAIDYNTYQGLKQETHPREAPRPSSVAIDYNTYQGLKQEYKMSWLIDIDPCRDRLQYLSGIETNFGDFGSSQSKVAIDYNTYQGLKPPVAEE